MCASVLDMNCIAYPSTHHVFYRMPRYSSCNVRYAPVLVMYCMPLCLSCIVLFVMHAFSPLALPSSRSPSLSHACPPFFTITLPSCHSPSLPPSGPPLFPLALPSSHLLVLYDTVGYADCIVPCCRVCHLRCIILQGMLLIPYHTVESILCTIL